MQTVTMTVAQKLTVPNKIETSSTKLLGRTELTGKKEYRTTQSNISTVDPRTTDQVITVQLKWSHLTTDQSGKRRNLLMCIQTDIRIRSSDSSDGNSRPKV